LTPGNAEEYTLVEALERFSDPADWATSVASEQACLGAKIIFNRFGNPVLPLDGGNRNYRRLVKIMERERQRLFEPFQMQLRRGELSATGLVYPISATSERVPIPADQWLFLRFDFEESRAFGGGITYFAIQVKKALAAPPEMAAGSVESRGLAAAPAASASRALSPCANATTR